MVVDYDYPPWNLVHVEIKFSVPGGGLVLRKISIVKASLLLGSAAAVLSFAGAAAAEAAASGSELDEVVVTAERRSENLQKVPLSVGVIGGDRKSTRLNSSHVTTSRMPSSA